MKEQNYMCKAAIKGKYGLTETMIQRYLGDPDKSIVNPHYHCAPEEKLWLISRIDEVLKIPEVQSKLKKLDARREKARRIKEEKEKILQRRINEIKDLMHSYSLEYLLECSKKYKKKYYIHCGPTNSGKTYNALKNVTYSTVGQYLGPLRLLAYEIADTLNKNGIRCSLKTGEEEEIVVGARFTSSTIEMCNCDDIMDYVIIDEAQLIKDKFRGHNYTKALLLSKAKEIHICVSNEGLESVKALLAKTEMEVNIQFYERLVPLSYKGTIHSLNELMPGDAIVAFSRKKVIMISDALEKMKIPTSIIYGNLPPSNRLIEIEKFTNKESKVLVCTDAIGMGISLPIHRIIFYEDEKYDGSCRRNLTTEEILQIAGRAGRYGKYNEGEYLFWNDLKLSVPMETDIKPNVSPIRIPFPKEILNTDISLSLILDVWTQLESTQMIKYQNLDEASFLYSLLKPKNETSKTLLFHIITCPFDINNHELLNLWKEFADAILSNEDLDIPEIYGDSLQKLEQYYRELELFNRMSTIAGKVPQTKEIMEEICNSIDKKIKNRKKHPKGYALFFEYDDFY